MDKIYLVYQYHSIDGYHAFNEVIGIYNDIKLAKILVRNKFDLEYISFEEKYPNDSEYFNENNNLFILECNLNIEINDLVCNPL